MAVDTTSHAAKGGVGVARSPQSVLKTVRPKLLRRASLTSWGKDNLGMTRAAAGLNLRELMLTVQQQKYEDRQKKAQRFISRVLSFEGQECFRKSAERRARTLVRFHKKKNFIVNWEREGWSKWNTNQASLCRYERRLLNYEIAVKSKAAARQRIFQVRHADDETNGIRWFEKNLDKLGLDSTGDGGGSASGTGGDTLLPDKETRATFRSRLLRAVLDQDFVPSSNAEAMNELRFRGNVGRRSRQEREHRRVKTEVDQRHAKKDTDIQREAEGHLKSMLEGGRKRRDAAAAYCQKLHDLEDRALFDKERFAVMSTAEQAAFETAFNERAAHIREFYAESRAEREDEAVARRDRIQSQCEERRRKVEIMCSQVVYRMVDFVVVASEERARHGGAPLLPTEWARLKCLFCSPEQLFPEEPTPELLPESKNPALEIKTFLESRNLDRVEGLWRPRGLAASELPPQLSPLSEALSIARGLTEGSVKCPREAPTYGCVSGGSEDRNLSAKLVIQGCRNGLNDLCAELGRWTRLYVCDLATTLDCAMEVGAEMAASDGKGGKALKSKKTSVSGRKSSLRGSTVISTADTEAMVAEKDQREAKETLARKAFDLDASEEDIAAFKEAAAAYHTLCTHPKKGTSQVTIAMTINLVVRHLFCRAPRGKGWILVGYPSSLIESKLFENALSGYTDEEVVTELGRGRKASKIDSKTKMGSKDLAQESPSAPPRSGLDAILNLVKPRPENTSEGWQPRHQIDEIEGGGEDKSSINKPPVPTAAGISEMNESFRRGEEGSTENLQEKDARTAWWKTFEGGHLACDVPNEANDERFLETLFLLVNTAQNRKDGYEVWLKDRASSAEVSENGIPQTLGGAGLEAQTDAANVKESNPDVERSIAPTFPLMASLEDLRKQRRTNMSHTTRIYVEALLGDRFLDVEGIRSTIAVTKSREGNEGETSTGDSSSPLFMVALKKLEAECQASSLVEWAKVAEFSFSRGLRSPDDRWTAVCIRLEDDIASWFARSYDTTKECQPGSGGSGLPLHEGDAREALENFEIQAGDIVDDRHASAEATMRIIDGEAEHRVRSWTEVVAAAAAEICAVERNHHHETIETLRALDGLFGLGEHCSSSPEDIREATRTAADALTKELSVASEGREFGTSGIFLEEEVRNATQEVSTDTRSIISDPGARETSSWYPTANQESQHRKSSARQEAFAEDGFEARSDARDKKKTNSGEELHIAPRGDSDSGRNEKDEGTRALTTAIWLSRKQYVCRLRGVVVRLTRAIGLCYAKVSSMQTALRRLKRCRVQLEYKGISVATSSVRRALEECDHVVIRDIIQNGIPLWVQDDETFAADPYVALPWGMSGLSLPHIMSLAVALRNSFGGLAGDAGRTVPADDLALAVRKWSDSMTIGRTGGRVEEDIPPMWTSTSKNYVESLCRAIGNGAKGDKVLWRRLLHCLVLGHVRSIPTLDDLRSMRQAFSLKGPSSSRLPTGAPSRFSPSTRVVGTPVDAFAAQTPLRTTQRSLSSIQMWFEKRGGEEIECENGRDGKGTRSAPSTQIKAVYSEAWGGDDARLDGLDLLLTLCAVPDDSIPAAASVEFDREDGINSGIPFSSGLFRAFTMLAGLSSSAVNHSDSTYNRPVVSAAAVISAVPTSSGPEQDKTGPSDECRDEQQSNTPYGGWNPRVTVPQLRALLEHGDGMSAADVLGVCELVSKAEKARLQQKMVTKQNQRLDIQPDVDGNANGRPVGEVESSGHGNHMVIKEADDIIAEAGTQEETTKRDVQATGTTEPLGSQDNKENLTVRVVRESKDLGSKGEGAEGSANRGGITTEQPLKEEPITISFAAVCDCEAVRTWLRNGAYALPSFWVTSGKERHMGAVENE